MTTREYDYPVWGTQGGGLARQVNDRYVFIEKPDCPELDVGDDVPEQWDLIPANQQARDDAKRAFWGDNDQVLFDAGTNEFFDTLFTQAEQGKISLEQIEGCFPDDIRQRYSR